VVDRSVRRWTQTSPKNLNMDSSDDNAFVRIMYFLDEMVSTTLSRMFKFTFKKYGKKISDKKTKKNQLFN
jgi:hypothetical protein